MDPTGGGAGAPWRYSLPRTPLPRGQERGGRAAERGLGQPWAPSSVATSGRPEPLSRQPCRVWGEEPPRPHCPAPALCRQPHLSSRGWKLRAGSAPLTAADQRQQPESRTQAGQGYTVIQC
ncbi:PREDICTED: uncharacterized protein LOC108537552 [Rhinopithecus bieti]|uniref:uncharacterized protein LOC108537552 n=1 Tax=Rhinopithecus bieti TaxID=61621 RepID=UPI00083BA9E4|nr:PREDICTED: uncharacterized protein LOC108537552 [Rhinopithecus bieti]